MDTRSIRPGDNWPDEIRNALKDAHTVVIVVGDVNKWLGVGKYGKRRIDEDHDWIRQEVALALQENKKLIPVLVGSEGEMVPADALPDEINSLGTKQAIRLRHDTWDNDVRSLIDQLYSSDSRPDTRVSGTEVWN